MTTTADNKSTNAAGKGPDIKQLADRELPKSSFPADARVDFRIALEDKVHKEIQKHAKEKRDVEICGVLVGKWGRDEKGPFLAISASIRGEAATSKFAEVTFTHDTWSKINAEMDKSYAGYNIVGWYHTHPDFGIFLSDRDRFIHENFFSEPGQVAYVVDPIRDIEGFFIWQSGKPVPAPVYWAGEKMRMAPAEKDPQAMKHEEKRGSSSSDRAAGRDDPPPMDGGPLTWITLILGVLCCFMLGFMLNGWLTGGQVQKLFEAVTAAQQLEKIRLNEQLSMMSGELQQEAGRIDSQARAQQANLSEPARQLIGKAALDLQMTGMRLDQLARQFSISPSDLSHVGALIDRTQMAMEAMRTQSTQPSAGGSSGTTAPSGAPSIQSSMPPANPPQAAPTSAPMK